MLSLFELLGFDSRMSLQWTFVATFLYSEVFLIVLLLLPFISPKRWQTVFRSRVLNSLASYANLYFNVLIVVLFILFFDAVREVRKYSVPTENIDLKNNPTTVDNYHMKLFRAQRNFYIAGFALFLWLVIRRIVTLLSASATLEAKHEAAVKQAQSATDVANKMMEENSKLSETQENKTNDVEESDIIRKTALEELAKAKERILFLEREIESRTEYVDKIETDFEVMKKQAESTAAEYDRLLDEHAKTEKKLSQLQYQQGGGDESADTKKDH